MGNLLDYESMAMRNVKTNALKQLTASILLSSLEDADEEFLEDDYNTWKELRKKRQKKQERFREKDYKEEFECKQYCKELFFEICDLRISKSNIPNDVLQERKLYENNSMKNLIKITKCEKGTLMNNAKIHGWKIGVNYVEPTIFDL